ncbi:MAG: hypothetical protein HUN04_24720 [Desulfobacter sp.]|nr:MAG: hypothetical protein HUN04_24720 [Desulfobacter sp.]
MSDPLAFLEKFITLYRELLAHDGYGDMAINIRLAKRGQKEIRLLCGREYRFRIDIPEDNLWPSYKVMVDEAVAEGDKPAYTGPERRSGEDRRTYQRRQKDIPRDFKLERRVNPDRRSGLDRRRS